MKKIFLIISILITSYSLYSQEVNKYTTKKMLGVNIGASTGVGISYKQWQNDFAFQITGLPYKIDDKLDFSVGLVGFYTFKENRFINYFAYSGINYMTKGFDFIYEIHPMYEFIDLSRENSYYDPVTQQYIYKTNDEDYINVSVGIGAEIGKNPLFTAIIGYAAYDLKEDYKLFPTIELGLHFILHKKAK